VERETFDVSPGRSSVTLPGAPHALSNPAPPKAAFGGVRSKSEAPLSTCATSKDGVVLSDPLSFVMPHERRGHYTVELVTDAFDYDAYADVLRGTTSLLVVSPTVNRLYEPEIDDLLDASGGSMHRSLCASGEPAKQMATVDQVCGAAFDAGLGRNGVMIAMGGGICLDIVTVAASMYRRGVRIVRVPTTLVGQIDAGIGVKGAVNFAGRKNSIGTFHPPLRVLVDHALLATLPIAELRVGLAEIIKVALVSDCGLFELLEKMHRRVMTSRFATPRASARAILSVAAERMLEALRDDPFEQHSRPRAVDAGHTFSPKLEAASGFMLRHGEAVAIDLALSATIAKLLGLLAVEDHTRIMRIIGSVGLPISSPYLTEQLCIAALVDAALQRRGNLNLPLFEAIGRPTFINSPTEIESVLATALGELNAAAAGASSSTPPLELACGESREIAGPSLPA
jgi:2-epi-5-epi-valiolone synthase